MQVANRRRLFDRANGVAATLRQEANVDTPRGLLALEAGDVEKARGFLDLAVGVWASDAAVESGAGLDFPGRPLAAYYRVLLRRSERHEP